MAKFSQKVQGKEVGQAAVYAKPHNMSGGPAKTELKNLGKLDTLNPSIGQMSKSAGSKGVKTDGIETRGNGAATKGRIARGPMA
jgi:hypothetical protein